MPSTPVLLTLLLSLGIYASAWADSPTPGFTWRHCVSPRWGHTTFPFDDQLKVRPECTPDTLYSWRSFESVQRLILEAERTGQLLTRGKRLYFWRTPIGSYAYGDIAIRVKLRPDANFIPVILKETKDPAGITKQRECAALERRYRKPKRAVYAVRLADFGYFPSKSRMSYHEYILCSSDAVESLSFGRPELREEMIKERQWIESHQSAYPLPKDDPSYLEYASKWKNSRETEIIEDYDALERSAYFNPIWLNNAYSGPLKKDFDRVDWMAIDQKFENIDRLVEEVAGKVMFEKGAEPDVEKHFCTRAPGYFNDRLCQ